MSERTVYNQDFNPVLLPGDTAQIITANEKLNIQCVAVGALPERYVDFGALTAGTWDDNNEDTGLEMNQWELAQFRIRIMDDMQMRLNNLAPTRQWRTSKQNFYLPQFPAVEEAQSLREFYWKASEFFVWEDDTPRFDFKSEIVLATSRVLFNGWRMKVTPFSGVPRITIWVSSWPSGAGA